MYLAKERIKNQIHYILRQSYYDKTTESYGFRDIFDLGNDPRIHLHCLDERVVYFTEELEDSISRYTSEDSSLILEELLWDFLPLSVKHQYRKFSPPIRKKLGPLGQDEKKAIEREVHLFDRKRIYFLRYNGIDQSRVYSMPDKIFRPLLGQSRDEREFYFQKEEMVLQPTEYKSYVFSIFNLQRHFTEYYSTFMPEALNQDLMADHLEKDVCSLNEDRTFWDTLSQDQFLHPYLQRYIIMFFDYSYTRRSFRQDYARNFQNSHKTFRWPKKQRRAQKEISAIFGISYKSLQQMDKQELTKLFRKKAKEFHPDKGGDDEKFITLCDAYNDLIERLK